MRNLNLIALAAIATLLLAGCAGTTPGASNANTSAASTGSSNPNHVSSPYAAPSSSTAVYGSGATFPKPLLESWAIQFAKVESKVQVSYGGGGSGKGIKDIQNKDVVFGGTDAPMSVAEKAAPNTNGANVLQFPETIGLIGVVYNVAGLPDGIQLDGETLGKIYSGEIKNWKDTGVSGAPDAQIAIVYRSDSSGTTFVFTDFLAKTSSTFASKITSAASKKPDWTKSSAAQLSGNGNDGVGSTVKSTPNSIGYVELAYVQALGLKAAKVKSHDGAYLAPSTAGAAAAASGFANSLPAPAGDWSQISIVNAPGATSYPISSFTYIMVYDQLASYGSKATADQMAGFKAWMWWCLHDGQAYSESLGYAPLPEPVVKIGETGLGLIH